MPKILITGKNSFIGKNFIKFSQFKDINEVSLIDNKPEKIDFSDYDVVLHLAAIVHQSKKIPESEYFKINRDLCLSVAEKARNDAVRQFIYLSTLKVYGDENHCNSLRNENSNCYPNDAYGKSKHEAEIGLRKLEDDRYAISIIRTPLVYGEGVKANMLRIIKLVDHFPVLPFGRIENRRNFTYTENLVAFIDRIIEKQAPGIFIAMDESAISTSDLVMYIAGFLKKKITLFKLPSFLIRTGNHLKPEVFERLFGSLEVDNSKTKKLLDFNPPVTTEEGLRRTVNSYLENKVNIRS